MLKNYLRIAVRNLAKYKFISFINLFGLSVGIACCLLILTYILHETSYDRYNHNANRTWRVTRNFINRDGIVSLPLGSVAPPFGPLLRNDFPDIQKMTRVFELGQHDPVYEDVGPTPRFIELARKNRKKLEAEVKKAAAGE